MKRVELLGGAAALGLFYASLPRTQATAAAPGLSAPADGVPVAVLLSDGAVMIDFAGPWEVFQDVRVPSRTAPTFDLYTVAQSTQPVTVSAGAKLIPQYDYTNAPAPKVVVVPGQGPATAETIAWLQKAAKSADVVMSVCTGAFVLADAGLLDGHTVTTHHGSFTTLAMQYPKLTVKRGARFVDSGHVATSAGLSAGIDLAMHVVTRYYGNQAARDTAYYMEYQGQGWTNADANRIYARPPAVAAGQALCAICWMNVDPKISPVSIYKGKRYYFCMTAHKQRFDASPAVFAEAV